MANDTKVVEARGQNTPEPGAEEKPCLPCLLPGIMGAWASTRAACEFLPDDKDKTKCREYMDDMAKDVTEISDGAEVILRAIKMSDNPAGFIDAAVHFAKSHNKSNSMAILQWAEEQEAAHIPIPEKLNKIIIALRAERGSEI